MWRTFERDTADELWSDVVNVLQQAGADVHQQAGRGGATREILHVGLTLRDPRQRWAIIRRPALNPAFALAEVVWIVTGRRDARFLSYFNRKLAKFAGSAPELHGAYGYRLRQQFGVDQLEAAYDTLRNNPNSRQVVLQIWDSREDLPKKDGSPRDDDIPCNTQSYLKIRDGRLEWMQMMRSNDVFLGLPHNLVQFTALQEIMAGWLGIQVGVYHHLSDSLHIYVEDIARIAVAPMATLPAARSIALPKAESDQAFAELARIVTFIVDHENDASVLLRLADAADLPSTYRDIARVLIAEGLRRRQQVEQAAGLMSRCQDEIFRLLWSNWINRLSPRESSTPMD